MSAGARTAVALLNLGGPSAPEDIEPFLRNFFSDPAILPLPGLLRRPLAALIAHRRARGAAREAYAALGGASPLLANTRAQAQALEAALGAGWRVFVCMRYWHPMAAEVAAQARAWGADRVVLLPLYPQFARATTGSALAAWAAAAPDIPAQGPRCYPTHPGFIQACADRVAAALEQSPANARVLFSAHGLPEREIRRGDPYQAQCTATAQAIVRALGLKDWAECYQSRVGPLKWIGPSVEEALARAAADNVPVVVFPHAFTQEHIETLVELDIEYAHKAHALGVPGYVRAQTVGTHPAFIAALADLARRAHDAGRHSAG
ncbi:MAG TPA: ferrochelatase [Rhodospirillaceae bacterium]|nr:ferrochelatase [Alphaproteobacteria bacterium]HBH26978.1 ferrochelatase [Rhodospirillaceae bacterium]